MVTKWQTQHTDAGITSLLLNPLDIHVLIARSNGPGAHWSGWVGTELVNYSEDCNLAQAQAAALLELTVQVNAFTCVLDCMTR